MRHLQRDLPATPHPGGAAAVPETSARLTVLLLTRFDRKGASSRLRFFQYLPYLESRGFAFEAHPLLDEGYLDRIYAGRPAGPGRLLRAAAARLRVLLTAGRFDLLWIEAELFPFLPPLAETWLAARGIRYVVDYDDAVFHRYDRHASGLVRRMLGGKIDAVMRGAALVVAGNDYLASRARAAGAERVAVLPTAVDLDRYAVTRPRSGVPFRPGWIGTPMTAKYLMGIASAAARLHDTRLLVVGVPGLILPGVDVEVRPWTEATEAREIASFDAGIMPLPDTEWERGKCGYKLIQYMACGLPVVASPVGVNRELVAHGDNGFLATTPDEWFDALHRLKSDVDLRRQMGFRGRSLVESRYCTAVTAPRLEALLRGAAC